MSRPLEDYALLSDTHTAVKHPGRIHQVLGTVLVSPARVERINACAGGIGNDGDAVPVGGNKRVNVVHAPHNNRNTHPMTRENGKVREVFQYRPETEPSPCFQRLIQFGVFQRRTVVLRLGGERCGLSDLRECRLRGARALKRVAASDGFV